MRKSSCVLIAVSRRKLDGGRIDGFRAEISNKPPTVIKKESAPARRAVAAFGFVFVMRAVRRREKSPTFLRARSAQIFREAKADRLPNYLQNLWRRNKPI